MPQIGAAIAAIGTAFQATAVGAFLTQNFFGRLLASVALSALQRALAPKPKAPGIRTSATLTGGTQAASFVLGQYATDGVAVCPAMSHGKAGKTPNAWLTYVIELSDVPGMTLDGLICDGEPVTITAAVDPDYGRVVGGRFDGRMWVRYYDGTQTAADPMLLAKYGSYPERPWLADMIGAGICYAIVTFRYDREVFPAFPKLRFVMGGIPLYDIRKDGTVAGGSGPHRWADRTTWEPSANPAVQVYNILRGIRIAPGQVWGGTATAEDLPAATWIAQANVADQQVALQSGGTEARFRTGFEVRASDEPATVIEELLKGALGAIADLGGTWKLRLGPPGLPVYVFDDADTLISQPREFDPHPTFDRTFNGVTGTFPDPGSLWEPAEAPPRYNAAWEAEDGGRRLIAAVQFDAVPYRRQVQRLMLAMARDERRFRRHVLPLPPQAVVLEPLDTVSWTSAANGYTAKRFEVGSVREAVRSVLPGLSLRETDPADYDWLPGDELPSAAGAPRRVLAPAQGVPGFAAQGVLIADADGNGRVPALRLTWDAADLDAVDGIAWQVRLAGQVTVALSGSSARVDEGLRHLAAGIMPWTDYEVRAVLVARRATAWTGWLPVTTPGVAEPDPSNLFPDYDLQRAGLWAASNLAAPAQFAATDIDDAGMRLVRILPQVANGALESQWFRCQPGAAYEASAMAAMASGAAGGGTAVALVEFGSVDATGVVTQTRSLTIGSRTDSLSTVRHELNVQTAANEKLFRFRFRRLGGGTQNARFGGPRLARRVARNLIIDGEVTASKLGPASVARIAMQAGAVSDKFSDVAPGPFATADALATRAEVTLGARAPDKLFTGLIYFEARQPFAGVITLQFQRRSRWLGGAWSAWTTVETWNTLVAAWAPYSAIFDRSGGFDEFAFRLVSSVSYPSGGGPGQYAATQVIREINLTVLEVAV